MFSGNPSNSPSVVRTQNDKKNDKGALCTRYISYLKNNDIFSENPSNSPNVVWTQNDKKNDEETWYTIKGGKISDFYFRPIFKNAWITWQVI